MKWFWRLLLFLIVLAGGGWLWFIFHPSPQKIIRTHLHELAAQVSFERAESDLTRLGKVAGITRFFVEEVEINLAFRGVTRSEQITGEMLQAGLAEMRTVWPRGLQVEFLDINVTLSGQEFATAELTMKTTVPGEKDFDVYEMKFALRKAKEQWLIHRVETVRTLK